MATSLVSWRQSWCIISSMDLVKIETRGTLLYGGCRMVWSNCWHFYSKDNCLTRSKVKNGSTKYDDPAPNESYFSTDPTIDPAFNGLWLDNVLLGIAMGHPFRGDEITSGSDGCWWFKHNSLLSGKPYPGECCVWGIVIGFTTESRYTGHNNYWQISLCWIYWQYILTARDKSICDSREFIQYESDTY